MIQYYVTNRSALLINPDTNVKVVVPVSDPAYSLIKHYILTKRPDDLKFFTDIGYRLILNDVTVESTRGHSYNIHTSNASYSTFPSQYDDIINKIVSYEVDKVISVEDIINQIKNILINANKFMWLQDKVRFTDKGLYAKGKYNEYFINFETNGVWIGKDFVCIHLNSDYKDPSLNEKETCILTKTLACLNDDVFFKADGVLKRFVKEE